jgi:hypothetical protein
MEQPVEQPVEPMEKPVEQPNRLARWSVLEETWDSISIRFPE